MQTLTELILQTPLAERVFTETELSHRLEGSAQRRHALVNRALKAGELVRARRGLYLLAPHLRKTPCQPFAMAQALLPGSYVSLETALAWHGWIPEAVPVVASVTPYRKTLHYSVPGMGAFSFHPLALQTGFFLELVGREQMAKQTMLVASPLRALLDLVCLRKEQWQGRAWLEQGLRIDAANLDSIQQQDIDILKQVYKQKRVQDFLNGMEAMHD